MPSLHRSLPRIIQAAWNELARIAELEGDGSKYLLSMSDVAADYIRHRSVVRMEVAFAHKTIWIYEFDLTEAEIADMRDIKLQESVSGAMRANLSLVAQLHYARLEQLFPHSIRDVQVGFDPTSQQKTIRVEFLNGHVAEGPERDAKSDVFTARCAMLYDLPPL